MGVKAERATRQQKENSKDRVLLHVLYHPISDFSSIGVHQVSWNQEKSPPLCSGMILGIITISRIIQ